MTLFAELPLHRGLLLGLESLQLPETTAVQQAVIPPALEGKDLQVSAQTGSGKTLAYLVPTIQHLITPAEPGSTGTRALVLVPTRELARQVLKQCRALTAKTPVDVQAITGGADFAFQTAIFRKDPAMIIATPGRLLEHCKRRSADLSSLQCLILDEADRMLDMGFWEDILAINNYCHGEKQVLMLSATLQNERFAGKSSQLQQSPETISIGQIREPHGDISHQMILADSPEHKDKLLLALLRQGNFTRALVFSNKRSNAQRLAGLLAYCKLRCATLHGDLSTEQRKSVMERFRDGRLDIISASDLAARGLDIKEVDLVINYDVPRKGDDYLHRTGRTGRAGASGTAVSLVDHSEWNLMASIQRYLKIDVERRTLPSLKARYSGPKTTKSSGKAAGTKKKRDKQPAEKAKSRHRNQKNKGKPRATGRTGGDDGFDPPAKKPRV